VELTNSIAAFDALTNVVALDDAPKPEGRYFYPNFARFESRRVVPVVEQLLSNTSMREAIFNGDDEELAIALKAVGDLAFKEGLRFFGFDGWGPALSSFIERHQQPNA
jgi:hypothetical protein